MQHPTKPTALQSENLRNDRLLTVILPDGYFTNHRLCSICAAIWSGHELFERPSYINQLNSIFVIDELRDRIQFINNNTRFEKALINPPVSKKHWKHSAFALVNLENWD